MVLRKRETSAKRALETDLLTELHCGDVSTPAAIFRSDPYATIHLRRYLRAQSQGHHVIDRLEERGVERGSARRSSFKGRERAGIDNRTNIGTGDIGTISERRGGAHMGFSECIDITLNWTELNWGDPVNDLLRSRQKDRVVLCIRTILSKLWSSLQRAVMHSPKETLCTQLLSLSVCSVISLWADQFSSSLSAP